MHKAQTGQRFGFGVAMTMVWGLVVVGPTVAEPIEASPAEAAPTQVAVATPALAQHGHHSPESFATHSLTEAQRLATEQQYGVSILGVRVTAAGHMLDFRYRVLDTTKAGRLIRPKMGLALVDMATKAEMPVPVMDKVGALKQTRSHLYADRTYSVLFANRGGVVKPGSKVSIQFGDLTLDNLIVE